MWEEEELCNWTGAIADDGPEQAQDRRTLEVQKQQKGSVELEDQPKGR